MEIDEKALEVAVHEVRAEWTYFPVTTEEWEAAFRKAFVAYETAKDEYPKNIEDMSEAEAAPIIKNLVEIGAKFTPKTEQPVQCADTSPSVECSEAFDQWAKNRPALRSSSARAEARYIWEQSWDTRLKRESSAPEAQGCDPRIAEMAKCLHYPDCWDTMAYPTIYDALWEIAACSEHPPEKQGCDDLQDFLWKLEAGLQFLGMDVTFPAHCNGEIRITNGVRHTQLPLPKPPTQARPDPKREAYDGDWLNDTTHENGNYANKCCECGLIFNGRKGRIVCKYCVDQKAREAKTEQPDQNPVLITRVMTGEAKMLAKNMETSLLNGTGVKSPDFATREDAVREASIAEAGDEATETATASPALAALKQARDALSGVIRVADRKTIEFDEAKASLSAIDAVLKEGV